MVNSSTWKMFGYPRSFLQCGCYYVHNIPWSRHSCLSHPLGGGGSVVVDVVGLWDLWCLY